MLGTSYCSVSVFRGSFYIYSNRAGSPVYKTEKFCKVAVSVTKILCSENRPFQAKPGSSAACNKELHIDSQIKLPRLVTDDRHND